MAQDERLLPGSVGFTGENRGQDEGRHREPQAGGGKTENTCRIK